MQSTGEPKRARVLDPVERVTEVIFGLLMAMTFTGTISVATAGQEAERTMMIAALGCNLAWGLADSACCSSPVGCWRDMQAQNRGKAQ